jgi:hypothetical protein
MATNCFKKTMIMGERRFGVGGQSEALCPRQNFPTGRDGMFGIKGSVSNQT